MKTKKKLLVLLLAAAMLAISACKGLTPDDAKTYVQSVLDASYKADFAEYTKQTDSTEEEAQALYDENMDTIMEMGGFNDAGLSEELTANYRQLFQDMLAKAKYEVGEAAEDEDGNFTVQVSAEPFAGFDGLEDEVMAAVEAEFANITDISQFPSDEEINEMVFQMMYDILVERMEDPAYGEAQTVELHVELADNVYSVNEDDLTALDGILFPSDNF